MNIQKRAEWLIKKCGTDNPFAAADFLGIEILWMNLGGAFGYYVKYTREREILIAPYAPRHMLDFICAHELGHAMVTEDDNTARYTAFSGHSNLSDKVERRASEFAVRMLLNNGFLKEHINVSVYDLARMRGIPQEYVFLLGV